MWSNGQADRSVSPETSDAAHHAHLPVPPWCFFSAFIAANKVHLKMANSTKFQFEMRPKQQQCKGEFTSLERHHTFLLLATLHASLEESSLLSNKGCSRVDDGQPWDQSSLSRSVGTIESRSMEKFQQIFETNNWTDSTFAMASEKTSHGTWLQGSKEIIIEIQTDS